MRREVRQNFCWVKVVDTIVKGKRSDKEEKNRGPIFGGGSKTPPPISLKCKIFFN